MPVTSVEQGTKDRAATEEAYARQQRGTRQLLGSRLCFFLSAYFVAAILARQLGAAAYGVYGVVTSVLFWLETLTNAGMPGATARLLADGRYDDGEVEGSTRSLLLGFASLVFVVTWLMAPALADFMRLSNGAVLLRAAIIDLPFAALYVSYDGVLHGHRRFGSVAMMQLVIGAARLGLVAFLLGVGLSLQRVFVVNAIATGIVCAALVIRFPTSLFRCNREILREAIYLTFPMGIYLLMRQVLLNLDLWSLNKLWHGTGEVVGQYFAAASVAKTLTMIPAIQSGVVFASVAWAAGAADLSRARMHIQEATRFGLIISAAALVILGLNGAEVLSFLFSSAYAAGYRFLLLQIAGVGLFALLDVLSHALMAMGRQRSVAAALIFTLVPAGLCNYLLIPRLGPLGAATSLLVGMVGATAVIMVMAYRLLGPPCRLKTLLSVFIAAMVVAVVSRVIEIHGPLIAAKVAILGGIYLSVLYSLGEITAQDFGFSLGGRPELEA